MGEKVISMGLIAFLALLVVVAAPVLAIPVLAALGLWLVRLLLAATRHGS